MPGPPGEPSPTTNISVHFTVHAATANSPGDSRDMRAFPLGYGTSRMTTNIAAQNRLSTKLFGKTRLRRSGSARDVNDTVFVCNRRAERSRYEQRKTAWFNSSGDQVTLGGLAVYVGVPPSGGPFRAHLAGRSGSVVRCTLESRLQAVLSAGVKGLRRSFPVCRLKAGLPLVWNQPAGVTLL